MHGKATPSDSRSGANPKTGNKHGETPLHWAAAFSPNPAVIAALLDAGADLEARGSWGKMPLHRAAESNKNPAVIAALLDAGANHVGNTPLHHAAGAFGPYRRPCFQ